MAPDTHVSLAELQAAGLRLRPVEAATIARAVAQQVLRGELPGVPSVQVLRLDRDGRILVEGPVEAGGRSVPRAAQLLDDLLPGFDAPPELRAPGALRLIVARGLRSLDLPAYPSLDGFVDALARFASPDSELLVRNLLAAWDATHPAGAEVEAAEPPVVSAAVVETPAPGGSLARMAPGTALTISDIRRARRATGLTLGDIATRSRIPAWLLRELEWGYFRNWPAGTDGRSHLVRYARAAGLDDQIVTRTVWPLVEREARTPNDPVVPAMEWTESPEWDDRPVAPPPPPEPIDVEVEEIPIPAATLQPHRSRWRAAALAALAIPALLALALLPAAWQELATRDVQPVSPVATRDAGGGEGVPSANVEPPAALPENLPAMDAPPPSPSEARAASAPDTGDEPVTRNAAFSDRDHVDLEPALDDSGGYSPSFAAVGTAMFYHTGSDGRSSLMRADGDSSGAVLRVTSVVDDEAANFHPRPSPDGKQIAFDSDREGVRAVFIADADGQNVRRVSGDGFAAIPSWSPDGRQLAYVRAEPDRPRVWNIWITNLGTGQTRRITSYRVGQPWGASWFPDGERIAYSHETRLIVRNLESGTERAYPSPVAGRLVRTPAVSPDGRRIMFQVFRDGAWLMNLADGSMRKVLSDPTAEEYTWAPDGRRVAFHSRRSGSWGVWVMASR
jgi:hypothetical protein